MATRKPLVQVNGEVQEIADADTLSVKSLKLSDDVQLGSTGDTDWLYLGEMSVTGGGQSHRLNIKLYGGDWTDAGEIGYAVNSFGQTSVSTAISIRRIYSFWYSASGEIYNNVEFKVFRNDSTQKLETYVRMTAVDFVSLYASVTHTDTTGAELTFTGATATLPTTGYTELTVTVGQMPTVQLASSLLLRNNSLSRSTLYDFDDPTQVSSITFDGTSIQLLDRLRLAASTTARAQLRLDSGVAPTSPGSGDVWNEGAYIVWRNNTGTRYLTQTAGLTANAIPKASGTAIFVDSLISDTGTEIRQASGLYRFYNPNLTDFVVAFTRGNAAAPDSASAFVMRMDGYLEWGAGGSTIRDTNLYRSAANVLKTDDNFDVGTDLRVAGTPRISAGGAATMATVSAANLTSGRVVFAGASGLLTDSANLTFDSATGIFTAVSTQMRLTNTAGVDRLFYFTTSGALRAAVGVTNAAESGSDAGSNFVIRMRNDAGSAIDDPMTIVRASAGAINLGGSTARPIVISSNSRLRFATDLDFYRAGDSSAIHFKVPSTGTRALIPETTTTGDNAALGTPSYRWRGIYADVADFSGSITGSSIVANNLTPGRVTFAGAGDVLSDDSILLFDSVKKDFGVGVDRTIAGSTSAVSEAAEILIASGSYMNGLYELRFDHTNRVERLWVRINAQSYFDQPIITVVQYFSYLSSNCFGTIRVRRSADSATMYITVTVSNLNGGTGGINVVAKLLDAAAPTAFTIGGTLPGSTVSLRSLTPDSTLAYKTSAGADFGGPVLGQSGFNSYGTTALAAYWHIGQGAFDAARVAFASKASGDALSRYLVKEAGLMEWGDGTSARDTNLYRATAGRLQTDDVMVANGGFRALNYDTAPIASNGPGLEMHYDSANTRARVLAYDRTALARIQLAIDGSPINFYANGVLKGSFDASGNFAVNNLTTGRMVSTTTGGQLQALDATASLALINAADNEAIEDGKMMTGFSDPAGIVHSYNSTTRVVTITHASGTIEYWHRGRKQAQVSPWVLPAHTNTVGNWFYYSTDGTNFSWSVTPWAFEDVMVSYVRYGTYLKFALRESHGLMEPMTHRDLHTNIGTYIGSGGTLTPGTYVVQPTSPVDADNTPGVDLTTLYDEDLMSSLPALTQGTYAVCWPVGAELNTQSLAVPFRVTAAGYINWFNAGVETQGSNNSYYNVYVVGLPTSSDATSQSYRWLWIAPQASFASATDAAAEAFSDISIGDLALGITEYVPRFKITYRTAASYSTTGKVRIHAVETLDRSRVNATATNTPVALALGDLTNVDVTGQATGDILSLEADGFWRTQNASEARTILGAVNKAGDTMNGSLTLSSGGIIINSQTAGRVLYTGTSGLLTSSAKLTYSGGNILTMGDGTADASFTLNKLDAGTGALRFNVAGVERGAIGIDSSENFFWESKTAAGAVIDQPITIVNSAAGVMTIRRPLTLTQALSGISGTFSSLTSGRVTFAGTSGLLSDNASLTFNAATTRILTVGSNIAQHAYVDISAGTGFNSALRLYANNVLRWRPGLNSSVGYEILALDAAGASIDNPVSIVNASAGTITLGGTTLRPVSLTGALSVTGTTTLATSLGGLLKATAGVVSAATAADVTGQLLTGFVTGANSTVLNTDSILGAFQKVQGQINARPTGTGSASRVAYWSGSSALTSDGTFLYSTTVSNILNVGSNATKNSYIDISTGTGYEAMSRYYSNFVQRWGAGLNASNNYEISAYNFSGVLVDKPITIVNTSAGAIDIGGSSARPTTFSGLVTASTGLDVGTSSQSWIRNGGGGLYMGYGSDKADYRFYCLGDNAGIVSKGSGANVAAFQVSTVGIVGTARVLGDEIQVDKLVGAGDRAVVANQYGQLSATKPLPKSLLAGSYSFSAPSGGADVSLGSFTIAAGEMSDAGSIGPYRHANVELKLMARGSGAFGLNVKLKKNGTTFKTISIPFTAFDQGAYVKFGLTTISGGFNTIRVDPIETFYQPGPVWDMEPTFSGFDADSTISNTYEIAVAASGGTADAQYTLNAQLF